MSCSTTTQAPAWWPSASGSSGWRRGWPRWIANKEARKDFGELLAAAGAGAEFVITCHGWPVARLGPAPGEAASAPPG
jgi:hypothetical protein